jgi:hypothetical protein
MIVSTRSWSAEQEEVSDSDDDVAGEAPAKQRRKIKSTEMDCATWNQFQLAIPYDWDMWCRYDADVVVLPEEAMY